MVLCANMTLYGTLGLLLDKERLPDKSFTYFIISKMNQRDKGAGAVATLANFFFFSMSSTCIKAGSIQTCTYFNQRERKRKTDKIL